MKNKKVLYLFLLSILYLSINFLFYFSYALNNQSNIKFLNNTSNINIFIFSIIFSIVTILIVLMPKFLYLMIVKNLFNLKILSLRYIYFSLLIGYIPILVNSIFKRILNFDLIPKNIEFQALNIPDFLCISIVLGLIVKKIGGTFRDWLILLIIWYIIILILNFVFKGI